MIVAAAALLATQLTACGGSSESADRVAICTRATASAIFEEIAPGEKPPSGLTDAAERLCRDAQAEGAIDSEGTVAGQQSGALYRKHASRLYKPICDRIADLSRAAMPRETVRYLTDYELRRSAEVYCAVVGDYFRDDATLDQQRLFSDHPEIAEPFCVAGVLANLASSAEPPVPRSKFSLLARTLCARLFKENLVVVEGIGQVRFRQESPKYRRVIQDVLREVGG